MSKDELLMFVMRLADHFKIIDPQEVLSLPADIITSWLAYSQLVGIMGVDRPDIQNAHTAAMVANVASPKNKLTAYDCLVFKPKKSRPSDDELRQKILGGGLHKV